MEVFLHFSNQYLLAKNKQNSKIPEFQNLSRIPELFQNYSRIPEFQNYSRILITKEIYLIIFNKIKILKLPTKLNNN